MPQDSTDLGNHNKSLLPISGALVFRVSILLSLFTLATAAMCALAFITSGPQTPSDKQMKVFFAEQHASFDELAVMFASETELRLVYPDTGHCETVDRLVLKENENARCDRYVSLFRKLQLQWAHIDGASVFLPAYTWGLTGHGLTKGYVYAPDASYLHGSFVASTDMRGQPMPRYSEIEKNWYVFFR
jgi:hypothetical protein